MVALEFLRRRRDRLLACYLGVALPLSPLMFGKQGSAVNYFIECALILSPLFAALLVEGIAEPTPSAELLVLLALTVLPTHQSVQPGPRQEDFARDHAIQAFLRQNFAPHTMALGYHVGDLARAALDVPIPSPWVFCQLVGRGLITDRAVTAQLYDRRFGVVLVSFDLHSEQDLRANYYLTEPMRQAILAKYQVLRSLEMPEVEKFSAGDRFYVWVPRAQVRQHSSSAPTNRQPQPSHKVYQFERSAAQVGAGLALP